MMLGGENQRASTRGFCRSGPLPRVERSRQKQGGTFPTFTPLAIGERVDAEVEEESQLVALPGELRRGRDSTRWRRPGDSARQTRTPSKGGCGELKKRAPIHVSAVIISLLRVHVKRR